MSLKFKKQVSIRDVNEEGIVFMGRCLKIYEIYFLVKVKLLGQKRDYWLLRIGGGGGN